MPRKPRRRRTVVELNILAGLNMVDYANDTRDLTGKIMGDPYPGRSALEQRSKDNDLQHRQRTEGNDADDGDSSGEERVEFKN